MGYRIMYSPEKQKLYPKPTRKNKYSSIIWIGLIAAAAVIFVFKTDLADTIGEFLLPGDTMLIRQAGSDMIERIRLGTPVADAITAFCVEIVGHGLEAA